MLFRDRAILVKTSLIANIPIYTGDGAMPPVYEFKIKRRGRRWEYRVHDHEGFMVAIGSERTRLTARYRAERSLFAALLWSSRFYGSSSDDMTLW